MKARKILILNGHPDPSGERFTAALASAYAAGASQGGHQVRRIDVGALEFDVLRSANEFETGEPPPDIRKAQESILWADHLVMIFPLWLGATPAVFKAFLEQTLRYGFALGLDGGRMKGLLAGRSARIVVTMGMPALVFRLVFGEFGIRSLERGTLRIAGVRPVRRSVIGDVEGQARHRDAWLKRMSAFGAVAA